MKSFIKTITEMAVFLETKPRQATVPGLRAPSKDLAATPAHVTSDLLLSRISAPLFGQKIFHLLGKKYFMSQQMKYIYVYMSFQWQEGNARFLLNWNCVAAN